MTDLYLVTGFLGAGKTTFLKRFIRLFSDRKVALVVNEFGKEGVDGTLLSELGVMLSEISNGSVFCSCRADFFESTLAELSGRGIDCIITETSGLSDPTTVQNLLDAAPALSSIVYRGCVCLADAVNFLKVLSTARAVTGQVASSSLTVINKTDLASREQIEKVRAALLEINPGLRIEETSFGELKPEWFSGLAPRGMADGAPPPPMDISVQKYTMTVREGMPRALLSEMLSALLPCCDRVKGFLRLAEGPALVNCVEEKLSVEPCPDGVPDRLFQKLTVLSGGGKKTRAAVRAAKEAFPGWIEGIG